jgi:hypothetical protein
VKGKYEERKRRDKKLRGRIGRREIRKKYTV